MLIRAQAGPLLQIRKSELQSIVLGKAFRLLLSNRRPRAKLLFICGIIMRINLIAAVGGLSFRQGPADLNLMIYVKHN